MNSPVNRPLYLSLRFALKTLIRTLLSLTGRFSVAGKEYLPKRRRACMLIANHAAFIDSLYIIAALRPRFTICGAKPKYFKHPLVRILFRTANILKVSDRDQFIQDCRTLLAAGEIILIYPEMGRNYDSMGEFSTWAAEVALHAGAEVIPLYIYGTARDDEKDSVVLAAGPAISPSGTPESLTAAFREAILACRERIIGTITKETVS